VLIAALIVVYGGESETAPQTTGGKVSPEQCSVMQLNREGEALVAQYGQDKRIDHLHSAISTYHAALKLCETGRWPLESAVTRNNTGTAYGILSGEEDGEKNLKLAVEMFEGAMKICESGKLDNIKEKVQANLEKAKVAMNRGWHGYRS